MNAAWMDSAPFGGQGRRINESRALSSRPGLSFLATSGGRVRLRTQPAESKVKLLLAADGPNVIETYDALLAELNQKADVVVFEPPGTGASAPARGFDFSVASFTKLSLEVLAAVGPRTLVFPCYLGLIAQEVARADSSRAPRLVLPQTPSWSDLSRWAQTVDPQRLLRTPVVGQLLVATRRRQIAEGWYAASTGARHFRAPFISASREAFALGGCFCLASLMQGLERSPAPAALAPTVATAIVWGARDRTHRHSDPHRSVAGAEVVRFDECGHSPELEAPRRFVDWLLDWHGVQG